jgi:hypothetical protein
VNTPASSALFTCEGGSIVRPATVLCDRLDGGHLIVNPPRPVWERSSLDPVELVSWSLLVAATGQAMLETLPVLRDGCLNYWEAGNWALNDLAEPLGAKNVQAHRRVHLHIFGRSRQAHDPDWRWGESPRFPAFSDSARWSAQFMALRLDECAAVCERVQQLLQTRHRLPREGKQ